MTHGFITRTLTKALAAFLSRKNVSHFSQTIFEERAVRHHGITVGIWIASL